MEQSRESTTLLKFRVLYVSDDRQFIIVDSQKFSRLYFWSRFNCVKSKKYYI